MENTNKKFINSICILDTSAILHKNSIIEDSIASFNKVIIPKIVLLELDYQKNKDASIAISTINNNISKITIEEFQYKKSENENNDDIIVKCSNYVGKKFNMKVYILNNDKSFFTRTKSMKNVFSLSLDEYEIHNRKMQYDSAYTSKLLKAVENNDLSEVRDIIHGNYNADVNAFYSNGTTPLIKAVENNNIPIVKELLSSDDIDIDILDNQKYKVSALSYCVFKKNLDMLDILVSKGARADRGGSGRNENNTPFLIACWDGWLDGVKYFSNIKNLSLNHTDKNGFTGLIKAVIRDRLNIVEFLCSCGKNIDFYIRCYNGKNAIDYCNDNIKNNSKNSKKIYNLIRGYYD